MIQGNFPEVLFFFFLCLRYSIQTFQIITEEGNISITPPGVAQEEKKDKGLTAKEIIFTFIS